MLTTQIVKLHFVVDWGVYDIPTSGGEDLDDSNPPFIKKHWIFRRKLDIRQ